MIEYIISVVIIALTIIFFVYTVYKQDTKTGLNKFTTTHNDSKHKSTTPTATIENQLRESSNKIKDELIIKDTQAYLIKSIKEVKDLKRCYIYNNGHVIVFSDDKRITLCYIKTFKGDKGIKSLSKNVDMDLISDISYSEDSKIIACALKNTKEILFYKIEYSSSKNKLQKMDFKISSNRVFEIRNVVISKNGQYVSTSVHDKDTEIQIYSATKGDLISKIDTRGIHNIDMKITPDDNYLGITTFLNEISVIHFEKNEKFNKEAMVYETTMKVSRKKSVSNIKDPILAFEFSNDERFFILSSSSQSIKVFQNFGNFSESKAFSEFKIDYEPNAISLFVSELFNGRIKGYIAITNGADIYFYDAEGNAKQIFKKAHEDEIIKLKLVKVNIDESSGSNSISEDDLNKVFFNDNNNYSKGNLVLISASRDGRIKFWDLKYD